MNNYMYILDTKQHLRLGSVTRGTIILSDIGQRAKPTSEQNRRLHSCIDLYTSNFQLGFICA